MTPKDEIVALPGRGPDGRGSIRLHYRDWGGHGAPVLLLHGLASTCRIWDLVAPLLARRFRVLAPDQRGHGLSDKPTDGYDFASIAGDLEAFTRALGLERPGMVGHSWGGNAVLHLATTRPEAVSWVAMVDGGFLEISSFPGATWERALEMMSPPPLDGMRLADFLRGARRWPDLAAVWSDAVQEIVLAGFDVDDEGRIHPRLSRENHLKILRAMWEQRPSTLWPALRAPALLIPASGANSDPRSAVWMDHKRKSVALAQETAPDVRVAWMEDTIHDVPLQRPRDLAEAIGRFAEGLA